MITYPYRCGDCLADFQVRRSIRESAPATTLCPSCGGRHTSQTFDLVPTSFDATPRTVGGQADRNWTRAGAYERESRMVEIRESRSRAKMEADRLPPGAESVRKPTPEAPWWRPGTDKIDPRLVNSTPGEKRRYLEEGKI